jgi:anthranilate/para-aminobenzoate synthase component I
MDLSVVIRAAIATDGRVMVQFGGAIVADSEPAAEWAETVAKGLPIVETLRGSSAQRGTG